MAVPMGATVVVLHPSCIPLDVPALVVHHRAQEGSARMADDDLREAIREGFTATTAALGQLTGTVDRLTQAVVQIGTTLARGQDELRSEVRLLSSEIRALIQRIDGLIDGRGDGRRRT